MLAPIGRNAAERTVASEAAVSHHTPKPPPDRIAPFVLVGDRLLLTPFPLDRR
jgi:hypothetical protein